MKPRIFHFWKGKRRTLQELCAMASTPMYQQALQFRLKRGWSMAKALSTPLEFDAGSRGMKGAMVTAEAHAIRYPYKGRRMRVGELLAVASVTIARTTLSERLRSGWDTEKAITTPVQ